MKKSAEYLKAFTFVVIIALMSSSAAIAGETAGEISIRDLQRALILMVGGMKAPDMIREYIPETNSIPPDDVPYTGVIIDVRGLGYVRSMSPKVMDPDENIIYGLIDADEKTVINFGIVGYATSIKEASDSSRVGPRPIVITAEGVTGAYPCEIRVSTEDAVRILLANSSYDFLGRLKVVVIDE